MKSPVLGLLLLLPSLLSAADSLSNDKLSFPDLQARAAHFNAVLSLPPFESTPEQIRQSVGAAIAAANKVLDQIAAVDAGKVTFDNTVRALDDVDSTIDQVGNREEILAEAHPDPKMRAGAIEGKEELEQWSVASEYRKDIYRIVKAYADTHPKLFGEDKRLLDYTLRDEKRAGLNLGEGEQAKVESLRKQLTSLNSQFGININNAATPVTFAKKDLPGLSDDFLQKYKTGDGEYTLDANVEFQVSQVLDNCVNETTRRRLFDASLNRAREKNVPLLKQILELRTQIAHALGYKNWADYKTEVQMAKTGDNALDFLEKLNNGLEPKFQQELAEFKEIKSETPGSTTPQVNAWDWRFCAEQLRRGQFHVNAEELRVYFPYEKVLQAMFDIYGRIFGIEVREIEAPVKYVDDLKLFGILDKNTGQPLGLLYLDMFPRSGKFSHFATFNVIDGKLLPDGTYQRPTAMLLCNFPPSSTNGPALMTHDQVTTIFHEFGHAMHAILTQANYVRFSGTSVPRDFVEAPSQMLEYFTWDKHVLDQFAGDYRDPSKKIPAAILDQLKKADLATKGCYYRRQLSLGILDLKLNMDPTPGQLDHLVAFSNQILSSIFLPLDSDTAQIASFGHLVGYDAGYYGYAWADAIAADMASIFEHSPGGFLDQAIGRRLRNEIYSQGNAREITVSIEKFLGRKESIAPFLKKVGIAPSKAQ